MFSKRAITRMQSIALIVIVIIAALGIGAWSMMQPGAGPGPTMSTASTSAASSAGTSAGAVTIRVIAEGTDAVMTQAQLAEMFTKKTGINVEVTEVEMTDVHTKMIADMMSGGGAYDVVYNPGQAFTQEFANQGYIAPVNDIVAKYWDQMSTRRQMTYSAVKYNGTYWGIVRDDLAPYFFYRTDIFQQVGITHPPTTIQELVDDAKKTTLKDASGKTTMYGMVLDLYDDNLFWNVYMWLQAEGAQYPYGWNQDFTQPQFNSTAMVNIMNTWKDLYKGGYMEPESPTIFSSGVKARIFQAGLAAMTYNYAYQFAMNDDPQKSQIIGKWAAAVMPGSPYVKAMDSICIAGYALAAHSKHPEEAKKFLEFVAGDPDLWNAWAANGDLPALKASVDKYSSSPAIGIADQLSQLNTKPSQQYFVKQDVEIYTHFNPWWHRILFENVDVQWALNQFNQEVVVIMSGCVPGTSHPC